MVLITEDPDTCQFHSLLTAADGGACAHNCLWSNMVVNNASLLTDVLLRDCVVLSSWTLVCFTGNGISPCCCCGWSRNSRLFLFLFLARCSGIVVLAELMDTSDIEVGNIDVTHSNGGCVVVQLLEYIMTQSEAGFDVAWSVESKVTSECGCNGV